MEICRMNDTTRQDERRRSPRYRPNRQLLACDMRDGEPLGSIVNLSASGFMLVGPHPLESGERLPLEQPQAVPGERYVRLEARCVWCAPSSFTNAYGAGFEIIKMSDVDQARLQSWLQAAAIDEGVRPAS